MTPEQALEQARAAASELRHGEPQPPPPTTPPAARVSRTKLLEWALIEPDLEAIQSTRRYGAPIVALKRALLRLLAQYHLELLAQQTRFNVHAVRELDALADRVAELERRLGSGGSDQT
jgi:hypothetical protein